MHVTGPQIGEMWAYGEQFGPPKASNNWSPITRAR